MFFKNTKTPLLTTIFCLAMAITAPVIAQDSGEVTKAEIQALLNAMNVENMMARTKNPKIVEQNQRCNALLADLRQGNFDLIKPVATYPTPEAFTEATTCDKDLLGMRMSMGGPEEYYMPEGNIYAYRPEGSPDLIIVTNSMISDKGTVLATPQATRFDKSNCSNKGMYSFSVSPSDKDATYSFFTTKHGVFMAPNGMSIVENDTLESLCAFMPAFGQ